ncbi:hypothetical protein ACFW84_21070 [Streptomyces anulatus]|uniref:hypothetical protein n=1 Tax=Streptomyces anulatus TaxID=1892 RepID=UPI0036A0D596
MRTRLVLASAAMGAALLTGGTVATVQAASAAVASSWIYVGTYSTYSTYSTHRACYNDGVNSAYADWECGQSSSGKWQLWVDDAS